jgi:hypothetical protein
MRLIQQVQPEKSWLRPTWSTSVVLNPRYCTTLFYYVTLFVGYNDPLQLFKIFKQGKVEISQEDTRNLVKKEL